MKAPSILTALAIALPLSFAGCGYDKHETATGLPKTENLNPNGGPNASGSVSTETVNAGGPGAQGQTPK